MKFCNVKLHTCKLCGWSKKQLDEDALHKSHFLSLVEIAQCRRYPRLLPLDPCFLWLSFKYRRAVLFTDRFIQMTFQTWPVRRSTFGGQYREAKICFDARPKTVSPLREFTTSWYFEYSNFRTYPLWVMLLQSGPPPQSAGATANSDPLKFLLWSGTCEMVTEGKTDCAAYVYNEINEEKTKKLWCDSYHCLPSFDFHSRCFSFDICHSLIIW